mmetsp:Transcript_11141/g.16299  ORF Transcript_11141/g.16299 Transcript_11141/m.16299 type:complete len:103 (+) Transcript_11141:321-629(+)
MYNECIDRDFKVERKTCTNKGHTIFNSDKKRKQVFTGLNKFKKETVQDWFFCNQRKTSELAPQYNNFDDDTKLSYKQKASSNFTRSQYIHDELTALLIKTKG